MSGGVDLIENVCLVNVCLVIALLTTPAQPGLLVDAAGALTSVKFIAGWPARIFGLTLSIAGLGVDLADLQA